MKRVTGSRIGFRIVLATAAAALLTGCSDATRFSSTDPFSNPFSSNSVASVDRNPTGTIAPRPHAPTKIESQPLAPPPGATAQSAPAIAPAAAPVASAPRSVPAGHGSWSAEGGTPIVVAQGETVKMLSDRYGVPPDALLSSNGLSSAGQVQPGARIVVPVYRNGAAPRIAAAPAPAAAPASKPVAQVEAKKVEPKKETYKLVKGAEPAGKKATAKVARADDDDDDRPVKADRSKIEKAKPGKDAKAAKIEAAKPDKNRKVAKADDDDDKPAKVEKARPAPKPEKKAEVVQPVQKERVAETKKQVVDREPVASLPPKAEEPKATEAANPEFRWPAHGRIIQGFKSGGNDGINIAVPEGTAVKAAEGGVVKYAGSELKGYGNLVLIQHPNGFVSAYAHNGQLDVKRGDTVKRGQTIAKAGQTGNVTTPQVHFELRKGAQPVDPTGYLAGL
jgi:murein DD-endopeptidase MepM/ murein hydrolase activator NlpD